MNFKVGDIIKTRDGREVEILKVNAPGCKPLLAMFLNDGCTVHLYPNGRYYSSESASIYDLLPPKRTREVTLFLNIYPNEEYAWGSEIEARNEAGEDALAVAVPVTFTVEY